MINMNQDKLQTISKLFEGKEIRSIWDSEKEDYYFSIVDVIGVLTDNNYDKSRNYWKWLKYKLTEEGSQLVSTTNQLKMKYKKDGKNIKQISACRLISVSGNESYRFFVRYL